MIHFLVTRDHSYTIEYYLETWGRDLRDRIAPPLCYEELPFTRRLNAGVYIFTDLERLTPTQNDLAIAIYNQLAVRPQAFKLLNNPSKALRRFQLLQTLHAQGLNRFRAKKIDDAATKLNFPVFLRNDSDHKGAISPLLNDQAQVDKAIADALAQGKDKNHLLLVEFLDTKNGDGMYRKYSYFRVGDRLLPRHLFIDQKWMIKSSGLVEPRLVEEELNFLSSNPHADQLRKIFDIAQINYGRIDYGIVENQVQTWEINTNPTITVAPGRIAIPRLQAGGLFAAQFAETIKSLDQNPANESPEPLKIASRFKPPITQRASRRIAQALDRIAQSLAIDKKQ